MENILKLNLLGKKFHIPFEIVSNYSETLLANRLLLSKYYRNDKKDYYFERNPLLFSYIITYYTLNKKIFCPHFIPIELLENECKFFQLNNPNIYFERNKIETYHYFSKYQNIKNHSLINIIPFLTSLLFMISISMETINSKYSSWSLEYFIELISTFLLTSIIVYQIIFKKKIFFFNLFFTILSIFIIISQNILLITNYSLIIYLIILLKIIRFFIFIIHLRILRLIILTFIQRYCLFISKYKENKKKKSLKFQLTFCLFID